MRLVCQGLLVFACAVALPNCSSSPLEAARANATHQPPSGDNPEGPTPAIDLVQLYDPPPQWSATALAFDPLRSDELWVTLRQFPSNQPCTDSARAGCAALEGEVALVQAASSNAPQTTIKKDGNAWHFMRRPTSIAFGDNGNLSTCGEARTDNYEDETIDYSGPVLWSSDPTIFGAKPAPGQNGTHIDMLHESPFCMGIAFEHDNAYWAFNGQLGALDRYDFHAPHAIGGENHADGELSRYVEGELLRVPQVPSHLALDRDRSELYVADTGHGRVVRLAIDSGSVGPDVPALDPIAVHRQIDGALLEDFIAPGLLTFPSGIALSETVVVVTDNATSTIWQFHRDGSVIGSWATDLPAGSLAGVTFGPDGNLYVSDLRRGTAYRVVMH